MIIKKQDGEEIEVEAENIIGIFINAVTIEEKGIKPYTEYSVSINIKDKFIPILLGKYDSIEKANQVKESLYDTIANNIEKGEDIEWKA